MTSNTVYLAMWLPEPPSSNRWWRKREGQRGLYKAPNVRTYQEAVSLLVRAQLFKAYGPTLPLLPGASGKGKSRIKATPCELELVWWRSAKRGDLDKRIGIVLDALQGTVYAKDSQVRKITAEIRDEPDQQTGLWLVVL